MRILVVRLSAIGDVIHALPVSYALKKRFPHAHITWVVEPLSKDLLTNNPYIDEIIVFKEKKFRSLKSICQNFTPFKKALLHGEKYDLSLDLHGLFKSAAIVFIASAKEKYGTARLREGSFFFSRAIKGTHQNGHMVERHLDVVRALKGGMPLGKEVVFPLVTTKEENEMALSLLRKSGVNKGSAYAILAVGASWPNKRWPYQYFAKLSDWFYEQKIIPILSGFGVVDEGLAGEIERLAQFPPINLVGKTPLKILTVLLSGAKITIGGDTGQLHLSAALNTKTIMLMGPTTKVSNGPYGQLENVIEVKRPCKYCWRRACPKGIDCLAQITVEAVEKKVKMLLFHKTNG